jgi:hypothetical protein
VHVHSSTSCCSLYTAVYTISLIMAPVIKPHEHDITITGKHKGKRKAEDLGAYGEDDAQATAIKKRKNKQRVLMLSSRGITHRMRHLMNDLEVLLPHVKKGMCGRAPNSVTLPHVRVSKTV